MKIRRLAVSGVLCVVLATPAAAQSAAPGGRNSIGPAWDSVALRFTEYVQADRIAGASAVFIERGKVRAALHQGRADAAAGLPVTDRTIFHWGSLTKTLGAVAIMQLRDRGRLTLDDPVVRWIPELRQVHDPFGGTDSITIRMLLSHSAGYQSPTWPWTDGAEWEPFEPTRWEQLVAMMPYQRLHFRPGSRYGYSNPAYIYLARIVELASGDPWQSYVQKNIFTPLGLTRSYFGTTPYHLAADRSHGYYVRRDSAGTDTVRDVGADFDPGVTIPNGGWNAPVADLVTWINALSGLAPVEVLARSSLEEMWTPVVEVGPDPGSGSMEQMGLGFFLVNDAGGRYVGHTGTQAGYRSWVRFDPATGRGYVIVVNTTELSRRGTAPELTALLQAAQRLLTAERR